MRQIEIEEGESVPRGRSFLVLRQGQELARDTGLHAGTMLKLVDQNGKKICSAVVTSTRYMNDIVPNIAENTYQAISRGLQGQEAEKLLRGLYQVEWGEVWYSVIEVIAVND